MIFPCLDGLFLGMGLVQLAEEDQLFGVVGWLRKGIRQAAEALLARHRSEWNG